VPGRVPSQLAAAAIVLVLAGCGARPQQAVGVSRGPVVHYLVCKGGPTRTVRLAKRPPFTVDSPEGDPVMRVTRIPAHGILRGDGRVVTAAQFLDGRDGYCDSARKDRAAAIAMGFAAAVLSVTFGLRWLRARRSRDPYDRAYR
jgi:hypothetical protein